MITQNFEGSVTNESLEAIIRGLDVSSGDSILSICGSGDQAFAMLEKTKMVTIIDNRASQINFADYRRELLRLGYFKEFLDPIFEPKDFTEIDCLKRRNQYFSKKRLKDIQERIMDLQSLQKRAGDIFRLSSKVPNFNKIYLSNALGYGKTSLDKEERQEHLQRISNLITPGGLIYVTNGENIIEDFKSEDYKKIGLNINFPLTRKAQGFQSDDLFYGFVWNPIVFEKR